MKNAWKLNAREVRAIETLIRVGSAKAVAKELDVDAKSVENHLRSVRQKMNAVNTLVAAVQWDRFTRGVIAA